MPKTQKAFKKIEKRFASNVSRGFGSFFKSIGLFFVKVIKVFDNKLTIMIVPHSQTKVINFQTNIFALSLSAILLVGVTFSFFYYNKKSLSVNKEISSLLEQNRETLASLDELRDENANLFQAAKRFQVSLSQSLSLLGIAQVEQNNQSSVSNSDLASLFSTKNVSNGSSPELVDIRELTSYLEGAVEPIEQIGKMLKTQQDLFTEIPMAFGPNIHPIDGNWYIHKGLDFSTWRSGDAVLSTASGQVVTVTFDSSFGNYIIIKHNHGMYTRYAHLNSVRVKKGQTVEQGEVIGTIDINEVIAQMGEENVSDGTYQIEVVLNVPAGVKHTPVKVTLQITQNT